MDDGEIDQTLLAEIAGAIPDDVVTYPNGSAIDAEGRWNIRLSRARDWMVAGHRDPHRVQAWLAAEVSDPGIAAVAEGRGYEPGDPWVPTGHQRPYSGPWHAVYDLVGGRPVTRPTRLTAALNRRGAKKAWEEEQHHQQQLHRQFQTDMAVLADRIRTDAIPGGFQSRTLVDYESAAGRLDAGTLVSGIHSAIAEGQAIRELAEGTHQRIADPDVAAWLSGETARRGLPGGDHVPVELAGDLDAWIRADAIEWVDYLRELARQLNDMAGHLDMLEKAEIPTARDLVAEGQADIDRAAALWGSLA